MRVINLDDLTGLPEYRNGGFSSIPKFLNHYSKDLLSVHQLKSSLVVGGER